MTEFMGTPEQLEEIRKALEEYDEWDRRKTVGIGPSEEDFIQFANKIFSVVDEANKLGKEPRTLTEQVRGEIGYCLVLDYLQRTLRESRAEAAYYQEKIDQELTGGKIQIPERKH